MTGRLDADWLWCARCESICRYWDRRVGVSDVWEMLNLHRFWHCEASR